ncbi:MAG: class I SAM-dependent methyltransferase [Alphaproteobacteria bacterium]|nr:class I SAM-dependent methyltransferase [Alphaproteobacteria bacterium]
MAATSTYYSPELYAKQRAGSHRSAAITVPYVMELLRPRSVVDIGCGVGTWLAEFIAAGVEECRGIDGASARDAELKIPVACFAVGDMTAPLALPHRYDLAVSLEVAEHLPADAAEIYIDSVTAAAPVILFSAAIPQQGGPGHINEQWQDFWREKFSARGFEAVDAIRPLIWGNAEVAWWYQQNTIIYASSEALAAHPHLSPVPKERSLNLVHPSLYERQLNMGLRRTLETLPRLVAHAVKSQMRRRAT